MLQLQEQLESQILEFNDKNNLLQEECSLKRIKIQELSDQLFLSEEEFALKNKELFLSTEKCVDFEVFFI